MAQTTDSRDIAEFVLSNKYAIVQHLSPFVQDVISQYDGNPKHLPDVIIDSIVNSLRHLTCSHFTELSTEDIMAIVDYDFITSISGEYFFDLEKYHYSNQN